MLLLGVPTLSLYPTLSYSFFVHWIFECTTFCDCWAWCFCEGIYHETVCWPVSSRHSLLEALLAALKESTSLRKVDLQRVEMSNEMLKVLLCGGWRSPMLGLQVKGSPTILAMSWVLLPRVSFPCQLPWLDFNSKSRCRSYKVQSLLIDLKRTTFDLFCLFGGYFKSWTVWLFVLKAYLGDRELHGSRSRSRIGKNSAAYVLVECSHTNACWMYNWHVPRPIICPSLCQMQEAWKHRLTYVASWDLSTFAVLSCWMWPAFAAVLNLLFSKFAGAIWIN